MNVEFSGPVYPIPHTTGAASATQGTEFYETRVLPVPQKAYQVDSLQNGSQTLGKKTGWVFDPKTGTHFLMADPRINTALPPIVNKLELGRAEIMRYQMEKLRAKQQKRILALAHKKSKEAEKAEEETQDSEGSTQGSPVATNDNDEIDMHDFHLSRDIRRKGLPNCLREELFRLVKIEKLTIKKASTILGINYSTAKTIIHIYHKEGRIKKKRVGIY
eukprot:CAMPEP_0114996538 /NCGR_PEP_ID=MMETSP0216-20121206/14375_1 /TAXON_ID=223996 /ORGANISM="Protocruzia adherens, Strain Boccale" /LENGTH=217 /DNA_ID=CAMNT_0002360771 /DNA_START=160 /DNA_END=813 /DNA_ORIENTATION=+